MDIKSIVRVFRFNELQSRAERDPEAKRPPTVKFMGVALALGVLLVMISFWSAPKTDTSSAVPLVVTSTGSLDATNETSEPATTQEAPRAQDAPAQSPSQMRADARN